MSTKSMILLAPLWLCLTQLLCAQQLNLLLYHADWDKNKDLPRCISGIDWSDNEQKLYLVSDQKDRIYRCEISFVPDANGQYSFQVSKLESFSLRGIFEDCNLEAIRVNDNGEIYLAAERGDDLVESFLWKGKIADDKVVLDTLPLPKSFQNKIQLQCRY